MENQETNRSPKRYTLLINLLIILVVAVVGVFIAYFSMAIFTKHGQETVVPKVENMRYTKAIEVLHKDGFNVEIRDSLFRDDIKPGHVIEQFPRANSTVKPGRKIFLYINAVHPKEVVIDDEAHRGELALKNWSLRQVKARLTELGFKKIRIITVMGPDDRVIKLIAKGRPVYKMEKVAVNVPITIEVSDGRLLAVRDSLYDAERIKELQNMGNYDPAMAGSYYGAGGGYYKGTGGGTGVRPASQETEYFEEPEYFIDEEESSESPSVESQQNE